MERIFISYTHADESFVKKLTVDLQGKFNVWVDEYKVGANVPLMEQIAATIEVSDFMLVVISRHSVIAPWVKRELAIAIEHSLQKKIAVIPLLIDNSTPPPEIKGIMHISFTTQTYAESIKRLLELLRREIVIGRRIVLEKFARWGGCLIESIDKFTLVIHSGNKEGYCGVAFDDPIFITGFNRILINIDGSNECRFEGWSPIYPKMMKVELDGRACLALSKGIRPSDDPTYIKPVNGVVRYRIPEVIRRRGYIKKTEIVIGRGIIKNLVIQAEFGNRKSK